MLTSWDESYALRVKRFAETYCRPSQGKGAGKKLVLTPWQYDEVIKPFYSPRTADGRAKNRLLLFLPRRNGKSFINSILALYHLLADNEPGPYVVICANSIDEADAIFEECARMCESNPKLDAITWVRRNIKKIERTKGYGQLQVLSSDKVGKFGKNLSAVFMDEVCSPGRHQKEVYTALLHSQENRANPIFACLSSAGHDRFGLGYELWSEAERAIATPEDFPNTHAVIYTTNKQWDTLEAAQEANPSYGIHIAPEKFEAKIAEAKATPRLINEYRTYRLNQWVEVAEQWISNSMWDSCRETFDEKTLYGKKVTIGVDWARRWDFACYCIAVPVDDKVYLIPKFFCPEDLLSKKESIDKVSYKLWKDQGLITTTPGDSIDANALKFAILEESKRYKVQCVAYDPALIEVVMTELREKHHIKTIEVAPYFKQLSPATHHFEQLITTNKLRHNHPVLSYCNQCTSIKMHGSEMMIDKVNGKRNDGISAAIIALAGLIAMPIKQGRPSMGFVDF